MVNNEHFHRGFLRIQFKTELFLQSGKNRVSSLDVVSIFC